MVFSSVTFLFLFLPLTLAGYYLLRKEYGNIWLLFMSLLFFAWAEPKHLLIILISITLNYFGGIALFLSHSNRKKKVVLTVAVILNLSLLFYYKYYDFCIESINYAFNANIRIRNIVLPIGISFFTFQGMSYVIDVFRGNADVQYNPINVALYIALFPQLIAGPIVRYASIATELKHRRESLSEFADGIDRFIIGLSKKAILANTLASLADSIWNRYSLHNTVAIAWLGSVAYSLQIFFDFSGYSDMAIGLGKMFGFHFPENFHQPYTSNSITDFWRRWHMSLSGWFKDYLYIPLGGSRRHVYRNLAIVFLVTGLWHGASWHFVLWGAFHGILILLERCLGINKKAETYQGINLFKHRLFTLLLVNLGWVLFRAETLQDAILYLKNMFGIALPEQPGFSVCWYLNGWNVFILLLSLVIALLPNSFYQKSKELCAQILNKSNVRNIVRRGLLLIAFSLSIMRIVAGTYNPFIYFQF